MVAIPGRTFTIGDSRFYSEEGPRQAVAVDGFDIDDHPVTNSEFARFVAATGHVTVAERPPDPEWYAGVDPALLQPGSLVFRPTAGPVPLGDHRLWWEYASQATWRAPEGPGSDIEGRGDHPVVHVAHADAEAYAAWAGKSLPTEAEWELAARGGLDGAAFAWGDDPSPGGRTLANHWEGEFPWRSTKPAGRQRTSPVGSFPPNGYGLFDMTGNVWEWTADAFVPRSPGAAVGACCAPGASGGSIPRRVIKGGSHLCSPAYCLRYRPAARQPEPVDTSTSHLGFRCVVRATER